MRESFEKALAERCLAYETEESIETCLDEARWAFEWCLAKDPSDGMMMNIAVYIEKVERQKAQLDHQSKIIAELKGAITEDFFCPDDDCSSCAKVKQALAKVKEMESKTP